MKKKILKTIVLLAFAINANAQYIGVGINKPLPDADLDVVGTVRLEHPSQGQNKVLVSNSKGGVKWASPYSSAFIRGTLSNYGANVNMNTPTYSGTTITVPPGAFVIKSIMLLDINKNFTSSESLFANIYLSDSPNNSQYSADYIENSAKEMPGNIVGPLKLGTIDGSIGIRNTTTANKTYYLWVKAQYYGNLTPPRINSFSSTAAGENIIYAIPIN